MSFSSANSLLGNGRKQPKSYGSTCSNGSVSGGAYGRSALGMTYTSHVVQSGDTLAGVALRYETTTELILRSNRMYSGDVIFRGQVLRVPITSRADDELNDLHRSRDDDNQIRATTTKSSVPKSRTVPANLSSAASSSQAGGDSFESFLSKIDSQLGRVKLNVERLEKESTITDSDMFLFSRHHRHRRKNNDDGDIDDDNIGDMPHHAIIQKPRDKQVKHALSRVVQEGEDELYQL